MKEANEVCIIMEVFEGFLHFQADLPLSFRSPLNHGVLQECIFAYFPLWKECIFAYFPLWKECIFTYFPLWKECIFAYFPLWKEGSFAYLPLSKECSFSYFPLWKECSFALFTLWKECSFAYFPLWRECSFAYFPLWKDCSFALFPLWKECSFALFPLWKECSSAYFPLWKEFCLFNVSPAGPSSFILCQSSFNMKCCGLEQISGYLGFQIFICAISSFPAYWRVWECERWQECVCVRACVRAWYAHLFYFILLVVCFVCLLLLCLLCTSWHCNFPWWDEWSFL